MKVKGKAARKNPPAEAMNGRVIEEYPVKTYVVSPTGERFETVCVRQDDGSYLAQVIGSPEARHTARTRQAAEEGARRRYVKKLNHATNTGEDEADLRADERDNRIIAERLKNPKWIPLEKVLKRYGRLAR